jgi:hypothetical protein
MARRSTSSSFVCFGSMLPSSAGKTRSDDEAAIARFK